MPQGRWLTPDIAPGDFICRALFIPNDPNWIAPVLGALQDLAADYNWEEFGTASPAEVVEAYQVMVDAFSLSQGFCRMIGEIILFGSSTPPLPNWLACDGSSLLRSAYPDLFAVVGVAFGAVDGTHFSLPDLRGRVPVGSGSGSGLSVRAVGDVFGEEAHTLAAAEAPSHSHADAGHTHAEITAILAPAQLVVVPQPSAIPGVGLTGLGFANLANSGGDGAHNNLQPSEVVSYYIVS